MISEEVMYCNHRSFPTTDAQLLLRTVIKQMNWSKADQEVVMDVGCGPGNSCNLFFPALPNINKMIGIDILPSMVEYARKHNVHEKIEYHVADIEDRSTLEKWTNQISKVFSIHCFHWVMNHQEAFKNIYHVLQPEGEAVLIFIISTRFWDSYSEYMENPKWSNYLKNVNPYVPESHYKKLGAAEYRAMLEDIGFKIIVCEDEKRTHSYPDDDVCRGANYLRSGLSKHIPEELKDDFKETLFQGFLKYNGRSPDGLPTLQFTTLTLHIQKPKV